ncbi:MAG: serine/threonine protein kinase [Ferruginibacter sp.]|nr:serine/threonine protein kinase [Chitinophagaceae bacterium]MBP6286825.1 serine/threonine protein kinase [Ferruginibacter sp.]MBU9935905.1 serine/threonine protein kinase [Ferruginibacter sp.]HQY11027.1 serine/threonine-protein kinase [Ferruginibacter sp.]
MGFTYGQITEIAGYHLTDRIGSGGMGDVYKGYNKALQRLAAVKILHQKEMAERFRNEAYIQASVSHPNIACMYEYIVSRGIPCIIMEYVEGENLDSYLHRKGKLTNQEAEVIIRQVASALAYLHKKDIVHRDIKPQNFKINSNGKVTMLDFGIAKAKYTPKLTQQGFAVGTTEYMAPEQFQQQADRRSDIWSLGVLAYELVTGYLPFEANNPVTLRSKIEKGTFTNPNIMVPQISDKLNLVIEKSLRLNPAGRITAGEIERILNDHHAKHALKGNKGSLKIEWNRKNTFIAGGVLMFIIVMVLILVQPAGENKGQNVKKEEQAATETQKLMISSPNAPNAYIVFPDGSTKKLPYEINGSEGQNFQFTIQAEGYVSREIEVPITTRRKSYEYNLEKITE